MAGDAPSNACPGLALSDRRSASSESLAELVRSCPQLTSIQLGAVAADDKLLEAVSFLVTTQPCEQCLNVQVPQVKGETVWNTMLTHPPSVHCFDLSFPQQAWADKYRLKLCSTSSDDHSQLLQHGSRRRLVAVRSL